MVYIVKINEESKWPYNGGMVEVKYEFRPQKKRDKETQNMRNNIQVGDEIVTAGGIIGRVVIIKEDNVVIETGNDRSKVRIKRWAIQSNETVHDDVEMDVK